MTSDSSSEEETIDDFFEAIVKNEFHTVNRFFNNTEFEADVLVGSQLNTKGDIAYHVAVRNLLKANNNTDIENIIKIINLLIKNKANPCAKNKNGETPVSLIEKRIKKTPTDTKLKSWADNIRTGKFIEVKNVATQKENVQSYSQPSTSRIVHSQSLHNTNKDNKQEEETTSDQNLESSTSKKLKTEKKTYSASGVKTSLHGTIYQLQLIMLYIYRALYVNEFKYFYVATEMDDAEKFDDLVLRYRNSSKDKWCWSFLQAKHKRNPETTTIRVQDLINDSDGDFSIIKYFISFCKIKNRIKTNQLFKDTNLIDFTLCTNTKLDFSKKTKRKKDGNLTADSQKHNEFVEKWEKHFDSQNLENSSLMFFSTANFKAQKSKFLPTAFTDLKVAFLKRTLEFQCIKNLKFIIEKLNAINILTSKKLFNDAYVAFTKLTLVKCSKKELLAAAKNILQLKGTLLEELRYNKIKEIRDRFDKKELYDELEKTLKIIKKNINDAKSKLERFKDTKSNEYKDLCGNWNEINILKDHYIKLSKNIAESNDTEDIKTYLNEETKKLKGKKDIKEERGEMKKLEDLKKCVDEDLENGKRQILKFIENKTSDFLLLEITLNDDIFSDYMTEFLEKFQIITDYPNVEQLNSLIKMQLGDKFCFLDADLITNSFESEMLEWLKQYKNGTSEFFSKQEADAFFNSIRNKIKAVMMSGLNKAYPVKLETYGINFRKNLIPLENFSNKALHVSTQSTRLTAIKVLQCLKSLEKYKAQDSYIFIRLRSTLRNEMRKLIFNSFSSDGNYDLLIIECQSKAKDVNPQDLPYICQEIAAKIMYQKDKKVIFIASKDDQFIKEFKNLSDMKTITDQPTFSDLEHRSQNEILLKEVHFQDRKVFLNQLITTECAKRIIDESDLQFLVETDEIKIGDNKAFSSIGYVSDYYIERYLNLQNVKYDIFKSTVDLFLITHATRDELIRKIGNKTPIFSWNSREVYTSGIVLTSSNDGETFKKLCEDNPEINVHWLEYREGILFWKHSNGSFNQIQKFIYNNIDDDYMRNDFSKENNFIKPDPNQKIIINANDPGVGKSTVMTSISLKMKGENPTFWIVRVNLNDYGFKRKKGDSRKYSKSLDEFSPLFNLNDAIEFITYMVIPLNPKRSEVSDNFQRKLFKNGLAGNSSETSPKIVIFFDGFDEISPTYKEKTILLLKLLQKSAVVQMWVTTRVHEKDSLECALNSPAYVLSPFDEPDQILFLNNFWLNCLKEKSEQNTEENKFLNTDDNKFPITEDDKSLSIEDMKEICKNLENYDNVAFSLSTEVSNLIEAHGTNIYLLRESLYSFMRKVDFRTLAEKLVDIWKGSIRDSEEAFSNVPLQLKMLADVVFLKKFQLPENITLVQLYEDFIIEKFKIFYSEKSKESGNVTSDEIRARDEKNLNIKFCTLAAKVFFSDLEWVEHEGDFDKEEAQHLARVGLLVFYVSDNRLEFVHRSFADFFLSEYLIKDIHLGDIQKILLEKILMSEEYFLVTIFFNEHLKKHSALIGQITLQETTLSSINQVIMNVNFTDTFFHRVVIKGQANIISFFIKKLEGYPDILQNILLKPGKYGKFALYDVIYNPNYLVPGTLKNRVVRVFLELLENHDNLMKKLMIQKCQEMFVIIGSKVRSVSIVQMALFGIIDENIFELLMDHLYNTEKQRKHLFKEILFENGLEGDGTLLHFCVNRTSKFTFLLRTLLKSPYYDVIKELLLAKNTAGRTVLHLLAFRGYDLCIAEFLNWIKDHFEDVLIMILISKDKKNLIPLDLAVDMERCSAITTLLTFMKDSLTKEAFISCVTQNSGDNIVHKSLCWGQADSTRTLLDWFKNYFKDNVPELKIVISEDQRKSIERFVNSNVRKESREECISDIILIVQCLMNVNLSLKEDQTLPLQFGSNVMDVDVEEFEMNLDTSSNDNTNNDINLYVENNATLEQETDSLLRLKGGASFRDVLCSNQIIWDKNAGVIFGKYLMAKKFLLWLRIDNETQQESEKTSELLAETSSQNPRRSVLKEFDRFVPDSPCSPRDKKKPTAVFDEEDVFEDAETSLTSFKLPRNPKTPYKITNGATLLIPELNFPNTEEQKNPNDTGDLSYMEAVENLSQIEELSPTDTTLSEEDFEFNTKKTNNNPNVTIHSSENKLLNITTDVEKGNSLNDGTMIDSLENTLDDNCPNQLNTTIENIPSSVIENQVKDNREENINSLVDSPEISDPQDKLPVYDITVEQQNVPKVKDEDEILLEKTDVSETPVTEQAKVKVSGNDCLAISICKETEQINGGENVEQPLIEDKENHNKSKGMFIEISIDNDRKLTPNKTNKTRINENIARVIVKPECRPNIRSMHNKTQVINKPTLINDTNREINDEKIEKIDNILIKKEKIDSLTQELNEYKMKMENQVNKLETEIDTMKKENVRKDDYILTCTLNLEDHKGLNTQLKNVCDEYEYRTSYQNTALEKLKKEAEENSKRFADSEKSFATIFKKYEKSKAVIEAYKKNEEILQRNVKNVIDQLIKLDANCWVMKAKMAEQFKIAGELINEEIEKHKTDIGKLQSMVKRLKIKVCSLETALKQKTEECQALSALYDDVTGNVRREM